MKAVKLWTCNRIEIVESEVKNMFTEKYYGKDAVQINEHWIYRLPRDAKQIKEIPKEEEEKIKYLQRRRGLLRNEIVKINKEIQEMNAYLYFISSVRELRKWYKKAPYEVKEIVREMPEVFQKSYKKLPDKFLYLVRKYCL